MKKLVLTIITVFAIVTIVNAQEAKKEPAKKNAKDYITDLSSNDEATVIRAADWLGQEKEKDALPKLKNLLRDDNRAKVRMSSAMAIGYIGEEASIADLNDRLLKEQVADVRYTIVLAITRVGVSEKKHLEVLKQARAAETDPLIKDYYDKMWERFTKSAD